VLTLQGIAKQNEKLKVANGQWELAPLTSKNEWNGTCGKCGFIVPAVQLKLVTLPFGRGEQYRCTECI
jgi:hypothetical protein